MLEQIVVRVQVVLLGCGSMMRHLSLLAQSGVEQGHFAIIWLQKDGVLQIRPHIHWCLIGVLLSLFSRVFLLLFARLVPWSSFLLQTSFGLFQRSLLNKRLRL